MQIKDIYYNNVKKKLGDGQNARFWEDWWVGSKPLKEAYPSLYFISLTRDISVVQAIDMGWEGFKFRRNLPGDKRAL